METNETNAAGTETAMTVAEQIEKNLVARDFTERFQDWEQTIFVLDASGSMNSPMNKEDHQSAKPLTKMELLRDAFYEYLKNKFSQHPESRLSIVRFGGLARTVIQDTSDPDLVKAAFEKELMNTRLDNSTRLAPGLFNALSVVKKTNGMWIPRLVVISDGQTSNPHACLKALQKFNDLSVIIDTIYIECAAYDRGPSTFADDWQFGGEALLKKISQLTGGVHERITSTSDFKAKFLQVAERLALPAMGA